MNFDSIKWWQWTIVGGFAGLAIGWAVLAQRQYQSIGGAGFISQATFEEELNLPPLDGKPRLKNILVYPVGTVDVVEMEHLGPLPGSRSTTYVHRMFAAPNPFKPRRPVRSMGMTYTVRDYLRDVARNQGTAFEFAWWRKPSAVLAAWAVGGMILTGGLWPIIVRLMVGAGFSTRGPATAPYDLDRFKSDPEPAPTPAPPDKSREQLARLEDEMLLSLKEEPPAPPLDAAAPAPPAPASTTLELNAGPLQPLDAPPPEKKHYEGEYYPVTRPDSPNELPSSGFALVELLVVLGIITVLISLLMPAVRSARQSAQQVQCAAQLRQVYAALSMYSNANKGWLPAWSAYHTWPRKLEGDTAGPAWTEELIPYLGSPDGPIYNCPSFPGSEQVRNYFLAARWSGRSGRNAMKLTDIRMTGRFVLSGDKSQRALYPPPFGTNPHPLDDADPDDFGRSGTPCLAWPWQEGGFWMHRHGNNVLFDDGHVALFGAYDSTAMTFHPTKMLDWADVTSVN